MCSNQLSYSGVFLRTSANRYFRFASANIWQIFYSCKTFAQKNYRFISDLENGKPTCEIEKVLKVVANLGIKLEVNND